MSLIVPPWMSAFGLNVMPSDGAKLYFYEAGTTTPKTVYTDINETIAATNPVVADARGRFDPIFLSGTYKVVLTDKNDVVQETADNLQASQIAINWVGDFDSSTNGGDYPASGSLGDMYRVTEKFVLNAASGSHQLYLYDFIVCNKVGATGIDADWNIIKGKDWLIDEDSFATNSDTLAPSQQSTKVFIANGTLTLINKTIDSANNTITLDTADAGLDLTIDSADTNTNLDIDTVEAATSVTLDTSNSGCNITIDSVDPGVNLTIDNGDANTSINSASTTVAGVVEQSTTAENVAGSSDVVFPSVLGIREAFNASGSAPVFACRAWINFDGTGTVAINASGNIASLTDLGTGNYRITFTTAMSDANYCLGQMSMSPTNIVGICLDGPLAGPPTLKSTTAFEVRNSGGSSTVDGGDISIMVFR